MKLTILQQDLQWANPAANCENAARLINANPGSDLYVLPEMFSTGFATEPEGIAEKELYSLKWMNEISHETNAAIAASVATEEDGHYYNRFYFVKPDGNFEYYDKHHLFTYSGEDKRFTAGNRRVIVEWKGIRILLEVCYDLRFPVWSRNHKDYDMAIYVASWPVSRQSAWDTLLRARAIENQCFVVGVNRVGKDPSCTYVGGSAVIDPYGNDLVVCEKGREEAATAVVDMNQLLDFRKKFPVLNDAD